MNINPGYYTIVGYDEGKSCRKQNALRKSSDIYKSRRRFIRGLKENKNCEEKAKRRKTIWCWRLLEWSFMHVITTNVDIINN